MKKDNSLESRESNWHSKTYEYEIVTEFTKIINLPIKQMEQFLFISPMKKVFLKNLMVIALQMV